VVCHTTRGLALGFVASLLLAAAPGAAWAGDDGWQILKGKHFIVHYMAKKSFAEDVLSRAEREYYRVAHDLGITRHGDFWLWNRRVRIFIHPSREAYVKATRAPKWSAGRASYQNRTITTFVGSKKFLDSVLPHEMTHLIFREFVGFESDIPLWLDEGVAQWEDRTNRDRAVSLAQRLYENNGLMPLRELTRTDVRRVPSGIKAVHFYAQAVSLVGFMIETHGASRFRTFCGHLRDGKSMDDALRFTYPSSMRNLEELERAWRRHLEAKIQ